MLLTGQPFRGSLLQLDGQILSVPDLLCLSAQPFCLFKTTRVQIPEILQYDLFVAVDHHFPIKVTLALEACGQVLKVIRKLLCRGMHKCLHFTTILTVAGLLAPWAVGQGGWHAFAFLAKVKG